MEHDNQMPFLDLLNIKTNTTFKSDIFRKLTASDTIIPYDSYHSDRHRFVSSNRLYHVLFTLHLNITAFEREYDIIHCQ